MGNVSPRCPVDTPIMRLQQIVERRLAVEREVYPQTIVFSSMKSDRQGTLNGVTWFQPRLEH